MNKEFGSLTIRFLLIIQYFRGAKHRMPHYFSTFSGFHTWKYNTLHIGTTYLFFFPKRNVIVPIQTVGLNERNGFISKK
jgi:hypothetical protein